MNAYEADIVRIQKKIEKRKENPDPLELKSEQMRDEQRLKGRRAQLEKWRQGKPFTEMNALGTKLLRSMGFTPSQSTGLAQTTLEPQKFIEQARTLGLPVNDACEITIAGVSMAANGDLPPEAMAISTTCSCTGMALQRNFAAHVAQRKNAYSYIFDVPFEASDANLEYVVGQFREFIEFAEKKFPGVIKYNEDRLIEMQAQEEAALRLNYEIFELLKHKPSPLAGQEIFIGSGEGVGSLENARAFRDDIAERVEKGFAAVPGEKLRMLWSVQRPYFLDPFKILAKRKVAVIFWYSGLASHKAPVPQPVYYGGRRKLTPLEREAETGLANLFGGRGDKYVNDMIWVCREIKIDAIINFNELGCTATLGLRRMLEETAEKELGIPTLQLEGKRWDTSYASEATINAKLDEFAQMCLSRKGLA